MSSSDRQRSGLADEKTAAALILTLLSTIGRVLGSSEPRQGRSS